MNEPLSGFPAPPPTPETLSYGRRLTQRREQLLANWINPGTRLPFREPLGETCGSCVHLDDNNGPYFKCALAVRSSGPATDIRKSWPACTSWDEVSE